MTKTGAGGLPFFVNENMDFPQKSCDFTLTPFFTDG